MWDQDEDIKVNLIQWFAIIVTAPIWIPKYIVHRLKGRP